VADRRETHHSDSIWGDFEFLGPATHQADRPLRISQLDGVVIARSQTVLEDERRDSHGIEPVRHLPAFVVVSEHFISAARCDNDRRA
jgi:hypothetical protein